MKHFKSLTKLEITNVVALKKPKNNENKKKPEALFWIRKTWGSEIKGKSDET